MNDSAGWRRIGQVVAPIGQPDKRGVVIGYEDDYPLVRWDPGVVAEGTPNPISEAPCDLIAVDSN